MNIANSPFWRAIVFWFFSQLLSQPLHFSFKCVLMHMNDANSLPVSLCGFVWSVLQYLPTVHGIKPARCWRKTQIWWVQSVVLNQEMGNCILFLFIHLIPVKFSSILTGVFCLFSVGPCGRIYPSSKPTHNTTWINTSWIHQKICQLCNKIYWHFFSYSCHVLCALPL